MYFTIDDADGTLLELVNEGDPEGFFVRSQGEWVDISHEEDFPTVYDRTIIYVNDDAIEAWDSYFENREDAHVDEVEQYRLK